MVEQQLQPGAGLLVLGMHRSGTSALSRLLGIGGADLGARVMGASEGNETGHWEDGFAVDLHEGLLQRFGVAWSDPFGLPHDWTATTAARSAADAIRGYVAGDRARHRLWAVKDPRLCLFAGLWREAMRAAAIPASAVLVLRPPGEIAASLRVRDGLGLQRVQLLWLDHMQAAARTLAAMPHAVISFDQLLSDWHAAVARVRALPAGKALAFDAAGKALAARFLDPARRHHRSAGGEDPLLAEAWEALSGCALEGTLTPDAIAVLEAETTRLRAIVAPLLEESRADARRLWERTARAEALVAGDASALPAHLASFGQALDRHQAAFTEALSQDLRRMQSVLAEAQAAAALVEERRSVAEAGRLAAHEVAQGLRTELRGVQAELDQARRGASAAQAEAGRLQAELDQARRDASAAQAGLDQARRDASAAQAELDQARRGASAAQAEAGRLQVELEAMRAALDLARTEHDGLRRELADATSRMRMADAERQRLQGDLDRAHARSWERAAQLEQIIRSRSWRLTRPLRVAMRWLRGEWQAGDAARAMRALPLVGKWLPPDAASASVTGTQSHAPPCLPPAVPGLPDVFFWAVIDWRFRVQRPQHLARALAARGHRVFYLSNEFVDAPAPGFRVDPLDAALPLHQLHLHVPGSPAIYNAAPGQADVAALRASLASVLAWTCTRESLGIVQHPYWLPLVRSLPSTRVVYDCMDHHGGFDNNAACVLQAEERLVADADLVIVTSGWLERDLAPRARAIATIRNAGEFDHFSARPGKVFADARGRRVIGYYGAIAEWFDPALVRAVAVAHPEALVVLVGSDTAGVGAALADLPNLRMVGEVAYADLPYWLHGFDVCLLPFKVIPLTLATNPVKVYEYLAAGKPVVSVDLPEMAQFGDCVSIAGDAQAFAQRVGQALRGTGDPAAVTARQAFAAGQTWAHRAEALDQVLATLPEPRASVVVLTYNNLAFTQACLFSVEAYSDYRDLEVIVVDNASSDGSREWLRGWAAETSPAGHARRLILNDDNLGFAAGNNAGLRAATGEVLVLLNNDTYVTPGWVRGLANHLRSDPRLGLVGPVTNNIGNEARIEIDYADMVQMIERAGQHTRAHPGIRAPLPCAAFFCVAMRREVYERVGALDEQFGIGFFEDDDYCRRVAQAGYGIACAEDVFVHHHLSASFDALASGRKQALFERNKALFEAKWGAWQPHAYRQGQSP